MSFPTLLLALACLPAAAARRAAPRLLPELPAPISADLSPLREQGYVVVGPEGLVDPELERRLSADFSAVLRQGRSTGDGFVVMFDLVKAGGWIGVHASRFDPEGLLKKFAEDLGRRLAGALPGESFELRDVHLRAVEDGFALSRHAHLDGFYLTATFPVEGPGGVVYVPDLAAKTVQPLVSPPRTLTVITGEHREIRGGPPATVHSSPRGKLARRLLALLRWRLPMPETLVAGLLAAVRAGPDRLRLVEELLGAKDE